MVYWLLIFGLVTAICSFHILMRRIPATPSLNPSFPHLRLKMPEPPAHKRVRVADMC
jgi:hypothetical protein